MYIVVHIPDIIFLILGITYLIVLLSIRTELRKLTRHFKCERRRVNAWSFEDQMKHRVKYLKHCRHLEKYLNNHKQKPLNI